MILPIKTFFERMPSGYRPGSSLDFARAIGAESMVLHCNLTGALERAELARRAGLPIWWWAGPDAWKPNTWRTTRARCLELIAGGYGVGYVPDCETAHEWAGQTQEIDALAASLDSDTRAGLSVGFTSFPSWPYWRRVAHRARGVWACPQLYGIVTPGTPAELLRRGEPWAQEFGGGYVPALAAWGRDPEEQRAYLAGMASVPGAIFWHGLPAPRGGVLSALRDWTPSRPFSSAPPAPGGPPGGWVS
jgi:hypothetical protein